jgi:hypothetical protein
MCFQRASSEEETQIRWIHLSRASSEEKQIRSICFWTSSKGKPDQVYLLLKDVLRRNTESGGSASFLWGSEAPTTHKIVQDC